MKPIEYFIAATVYVFLLTTVSVMWIYERGIRVGESSASRCFLKNYEEYLEYEHMTGKLWPDPLIRLGEEE